MHVISNHQISHLENFHAGVQHARAKFPDGLTVHHTIVSKDGDCAICLIEAETMQHVIDFVDEFVGEHSTSTYFEVHNETSLGLPGA